MSHCNNTARNPWANEKCTLFEVSRSGPSPGSIENYLCDLVGDIKFHTGTEFYFLRQKQKQKQCCLSKDFFSSILD